MTAREIELGAVVALLVGLWEQARAVWRWLAGFVIVTRRADYGLAPVLLAYLRVVGRWHPRNDGLHTSHLAWIKLLGHEYRVFYQLMSRSDQRFLIGDRGGPGWRPVWYSIRGSGADGTAGNTHLPPRLGGLVLPVVLVPARHARLGRAPARGCCVGSGAAHR